MTGIIGAMDVEVARIQEGMCNVRKRTIAGMIFCEGEIDGKLFVVVKCGIGKVNAAICVQILADCFHVEQIINTGIAGSLCNDINIGDVVLSVDAIQHDMDVSALGYAKGQIPGCECLAFSADEALRNRVKIYLNSTNPEFRVFEGRVLSGDQFISGNDKKEYLQRQFQGKCAEMEGAAIAQAASRNEIPFLIIRAISDKADGSAQVDYPSFEKETAQKLADMILELAHVL